MKNKYFSNQLHVSILVNGVQLSQYGCVTFLTLHSSLYCHLARKESYIWVNNLNWHTNKVRIIRELEEETIKEKKIKKR